MCVSFTGEELREILGSCLDLYRSGEVYMDPGFASEYSAAVAYLTKRIENTEGVSEALRYVVTDVLDFSLSAVAEDVGLEEGTISKYVSSVRNPSVGVVLAICLCCHLPPQVTYAVLKKTHYNFVAGNKKDAAYLSLVDHYWMHGDIAEINALLVSQGVKPLTKKFPEG